MQMNFLKASRPAPESGNATTDADADFMFMLDDRQPKRELRPILAQLAPAFDEWDTAVWFSRPNPWLSGEVPANLLSSHATDVEEAARADRFARRG